MDASPYRSMGSLKGQPLHLGIRKDYEVPDNYVVASPGGLSTTHHHPTGGMYGHGNSTSDHYGPSNPAYPSGNYGNMYQPGHTSAQALGYYPPKTDPQFWNNQEPPQSYDDSFEFVEPADVDMSGIENFEIDKKKKYPFKVSPTVVLILFIMAFIAFAFFADSLQKFIQLKFHKGKEVPWYWMMGYGAAILVFVIIAANVSGIPLVVFEDL